MTNTPLTVLVTGATGTLGRALLPVLRDGGHRVRAMSRQARSDATVSWYTADLSTGAGLAAALAGADAVVHLASAPYQGRYTAAVDVAGTRRLAAAARDAGARPLLYVSIVGVDRVPSAYYRTKLAAEEVVRSGRVPWTTLRATQFPQLLDRGLTALGRLGVLPVDRAMLAQPVHPVDVAGRIADLLGSGPSATIVQYGGPEVLRLDELARQWQLARGSRRPILPVRLPGRFARAVRAGALTTAATPAGTLTWADHLAATYGATR